MGYRWQSYHLNYDRSEVITDKDKCARTYAGYFYTRLLKMFHYEGLPETIPQDVLEYYLLRNGSCFITKAKIPGCQQPGTQVGGDDGDENLFAFIGNPGGVHDAYYRPTLYVCSNPYLNITFEKPMWGDEGVFCINDSMWIGLDPLIQRYSYLMAENVLTMRTADIMLRIVALISASDDRTKESADQFLQDIEDGKLGTIGDNPFFEGVKMQSPPSNNGSYLTQFIELHQYYKGSFYNEIGLQANFNMKREAIGVGEAAMSEDSLLPLCDDMLEKRKEMCEKLNSLYGLNVTVDFASAWKQTREEIERSLSDAGCQQPQEGGDKSGKDNDEEFGDDGSGIEDVGGSEPEDAEEEKEEAGSEEEETGSGAGDKEISLDEAEANDEESVKAEVEVKVEVNVEEQYEEETEDSRSDDTVERSISEDGL